MLMANATETSGASREFNILEFTAQNSVHKSILIHLRVRMFVYIQGQMFNCSVRNTFQTISLQKERTVKGKNITKSL